MCVMRGRPIISSISALRNCNALTRLVSLVMLALLMGFVFGGHYGK